MKKLVLLLALSLGGCATLQTDWNVLTGASVSPTAVIVAGNSFDVLEATATNYLRLPRCKAGGPVVCSNPQAVVEIKTAVRAGRVARNNLEAFMISNPGQLGPTGLYSALVAASKTLQQVFFLYNIGSAS